jgi:hypothetical protein
MTKLNFGYSGAVILQRGYDGKIYRRLLDRTEQECTQQ